MTKLFLHIGAEKTGTTSIQRALNKSRKQLFAEGLAVSGCLGEENHKMLVAYSLPANSKDVALRSQKLGDDEGSYELFCRNIERILSNEVGSLTVDNYCITSEDFHRLLEKRDLNRVSKLLTSLFEEIEIILFIRRQDRLATSRYNTLVQFGYQKRFRFEEISEGEILRFYNYKKIIERWIDAFPYSKLTVVPYGSETVNCKESSVALMSNVLGVSNMIEPKVKLNQSFDSLQLRLIQILRANQDVVNGADPIRFIRSMPDDGAAPKLPASPEAAASFVSRFSSVNEWVANNFLNGDELFNDDYSAYNANFSWENIERRVNRWLLRALVAARNT